MANIFISRLNFYLVLFFPITIISGPFLPDLICSLSGCIFIYLSIKHKLKKYFISKFFILFLIFYLIILTSSLISKNPIHSLESSLFYFRFGVLALNFWYLVDTNGEKFLKYLTYSVIISILIASFSGYFEYFFQFIINDNSLNIDKNNAIRVSGIFGEELVLGSYISRFLPISIGLLYFTFFNKLRIFKINLLIIIYLFFLILITFISGERTAILNITIFLILAFLLINFNLRIKIISLFVFIISIFTLISLDSRIYNRLILKTLNDISNINLEENINKFYYISEEHHNAALISLNMFRENIIFGIGPKMYRYECKNLKYLKNVNYGSHCFMHPHNTYLQLISETGLSGSLFIVLVFIFISLKLFSRKSNKLINLRYKNFKIFLYISIFITLWPLNQNGNFFNNWLNFIYFFPIGIILSIEKIKEIDSS